MEGMEVLGREVTCFHTPTTHWGHSFLEEFSLIGCVITRWFWLYS